MAKFKVGDKIWVDPSYASNLNVGYGWNVGVVRKAGPDNTYEVEFKGHGVITVPGEYCAKAGPGGKPVFGNSVRTTDPVVRNAMELMARNANGGEHLKISRQPNGVWQVTGAKGSGQGPEFRTEAEAVAWCERNGAVMNGQFRSALESAVRGIGYKQKVSDGNDGCYVTAWGRNGEKAEDMGRRITEAVKRVLGDRFGGEFDRYMNDSANNFYDGKDHHGEATAHIKFRIKNSVSCESILRSKRVLNAEQSFKKGDHVEFVSPSYMKGKDGTVLRFDGSRYLVELVNLPGQDWFGPECLKRIGANSVMNDSGKHTFWLRAYLDNGKFVSGYAEAKTLDEAKKMYTGWLNNKAKHSYLDGPQYKYTKVLRVEEEKR